MTHVGDVDPFTSTHAHAFPALPRHAAIRTQKTVSGMMRATHGIPRPKLPAFTCAYVLLRLCKKPGAAALQSLPLACLVNKEREGLCAQTEVKRPGLGEGRGGPGMRGVVSEKMVSIDTVGAALHMGGTAASRSSR